MGVFLFRMRTFHVGCKIENHVDRRQAVTVARALVDTGSEYTWIPSAVLERIGVKREKKDLLFTMANGQTITRSVGFAILRVDKHFTIDEVVFAEPGDMTLLGGKDVGGPLVGGRFPQEETGGCRTAPGGLSRGVTSRAYRSM